MLCAKFNAAAVMVFGMISSSNKPVTSKPSELVIYVSDSFSLIAICARTSRAKIKPTTTTTV